MKSLSSIVPGQPRSNNRGQLTRSCLPIVGTAILVFIVSGGFPPTTWRYLFQTLPQLNRLFVSQGPGVIFPLTILIVQSLLLAIAWGLLVWVVLREGAYLMTLQSKAELDRLLAFQSSDGSLLGPSQMLAKNLPEKDFDVGLDMLEEQDFGMTTDQLEELDFDITMGQLERHSVPIQPLRTGDKAFGSHTTFKDGDPNALQNAFEELDLNVAMAPPRREANMTTSLRREKDINMTKVPPRRETNTTTSQRREKSIDVPMAPPRREANTTTSQDIDMTMAPPRREANTTTSLRREKGVDVTTAPPRREANTTTSLRREKGVDVTTAPPRREANTTTSLRREKGVDVTTAPLDGKPIRRPP